MGKIFDYCLRKIYGIPSLSVIGGVWKVGKTDFALYLAENLLRLGLVSRVASNIETGDERVKFLSSLDEVRYWLHKGSYLKLYILDEGNVHLLKRTPMARMNVDSIRLLGEVSKAHGRLIIVAQEVLGVDSEFLNPTWLRAIWYKTSLKNVRLNSHLIGREMNFRNIPKTTIPFDPYRIAPFTKRPLHGMIEIFGDKETDLLWHWSNGTSSQKLGIHPMQLNRMVRRFVRTTLEPKYKDRLEIRV